MKNPADTPCKACPHAAREHGDDVCWVDTCECAGLMVDTPAWVVPDGYQPDGVGACSTCHQVVLWVHTRNAKRMPLDPDGTSHFATCPQADLHRRTRPHPLAMVPRDHSVEDHA